MGKRILIIDDEPDIRSVAQLGLQMGAGWEVLTAESGAEGIAAAITHQPDAILLDMMMPDLDGRAALALLQANPQTQEIPVILLTAKAHLTTSNDLEALGAAAILPKPFRPLKLAAQIADCLGWALEGTPSPQ